MVEIMELAVGQTHVQPIVWHGGVHGHAGGAHVAGVPCGVLYPLHYSNFPG